MAGDGPLRDKGGRNDGERPATRLLQGLVQDHAGGLDGHEMPERIRPPGPSPVPAAKGKGKYNATGKGPPPPPPGVDGKGKGAGAAQKDRLAAGGGRSALLDSIHNQRVEPGGPTSPLIGSSCSDDDTSGSEDEAARMLAMRGLLRG